MFPTPFNPCACGSTRFVLVPFAGALATHDVELGYMSAAWSCDEVNGGCGALVLVSGPDPDTGQPVQSAITAPRGRRKRGA